MTPQNQAVLVNNKENNKLNFSRLFIDRRNTLLFLLLVLPAIILYAIFMLYPLVNMFRISLFDWNGILGKKTFIGIANFIDLFSNRSFKIAAMNTLRVVLVALPGVILPAYMFGFFLSLRPRGFRIFRAIFFLPVMISAAAQGMIFLIIYSPGGILNTLLTQIGLDPFTRIWLADPKTALAAVISVDLWADIGLHSVLFFAACSNISFELYEAARIDGANNWDIMWKIALPIIKDYFGISIVLHLLWLLLGSAQNVLLLTKGGPGSYTLTLGYYLYELAFVNNRMGYSQAIGVLIFIIGILCMIVIRKLTRQKSN